MADENGQHPCADPSCPGVLCGPGGALDYPGEQVAESADPGWSPVATTIACDWCGECEWCLNYYPPEPPLPEPEYVHCTCGHPNDDHSALGECPFPGCGCGRLDPSKDPTPPEEQATS